MDNFSNSEGTKIYFTISKNVNDVFDMLLKYKNQDKLDWFINECMDQYDRKNNYNVPDSEKTTISLDISSCDDSTRGAILYWGKFTMKQYGFFEFMARAYCTKILQQINRIFPNISIDANDGQLQNMTTKEKAFHAFLTQQKRKPIGTGAANTYIIHARKIKDSFGISIYDITDIDQAENLCNTFTSWGQCSDFNAKLHGAPHALTRAYIEYLGYLQNN